MNREKLDLRLSEFLAAGRAGKVGELVLWAWKHDYISLQEADYLIDAALAAV